MLNLANAVALEKGLITLKADVTPDRRLHATSGQARSLYAELTRNAATRTKPEGGAMPSIVERFVTQALRTAEDQKANPDTVIKERLSHLQELTNGYDFASVIGKYWQAYDQDNEDLKTHAIQWLRGEFSTRTDARKALGVRTIVDDANFYDQLKLLALFVKEAGYTGLFVVLDELVNLYKMNSTQARQSNYEQILRILNDTLQGSAQYIGFMFGGTPEFLMDPRRGLYSYQALQSRLAENRFAQNGYTDLSGPVLRLPKLTQEELFVLLTKIRTVILPDQQENLPDQALHQFMNHCAQRIGNSYFQTPRNTIKTYVDLLSILQQNPQANWQDLLNQAEPQLDYDPHRPNQNSLQEQETDDLSSFRI